MLKQLDLSRMHVILSNSNYDNKWALCVSFCSHKHRFVPVLINCRPIHRVRTVLRSLGTGFIFWKAGWIPITRTSEIVCVSFTRVAQYNYDDSTTAKVLAADSRIDNRYGS